MPEPTHFLLDIIHPSRTHQSFKVVRDSKGGPLLLGEWRLHENALAEELGSVGGLHRTSEILLLFCK